MNLMTKTAWTFGVLMAFACPGLAQQAAAPDYHQQVTPILKKYCFGCHNPEKADGDLILDDYKLMLEGGKRGPALVPGKSGESRLTLTLEGKAKPKMPPKDNPAPSAAEIAVLKAWIDAGAHGPTKAVAAPTLTTPKIAPKKSPTLSVNAVAFSPKGDSVAIAKHDAVLLVDPKTQFIERRLAGHSGPVTSVRYSKDGALLVTAAGEPGLFGEARIWNSADGKLVRTIKAHSDSLYAAELSGDGKLLATAGYDKDIRLWDVATGAERKPLTGHNDAVYALAFSPDNRFLASASGDNTVKLWDVAKGERLDTFVQPAKSLYTVAFSPDGKRVTAGGIDNRIRVWQISADGKEGTNPIVYSRFAHQGSIIKLVYSSDGKTLVSSADDRTIKLWAADALTETHLLERQPDWAAALALSPDNKSLLVGRHDGSLALYYTANGAKAGDLKPTVKPPPKPEIAALSLRGIQRGKTAHLTITGKHLAGATGLNFSNPKITGKIVVPKSKAPSTSVDVELLAAADTPRGAYDISVNTPGGTSGPLKLHVDDLPQLTEQEPNNSLAQPMPTPLGTSLWGSFAAPGDSDYFAFDLKKGQTIVFDVAANSLGAKLNGVVTLFDAKGKTVASSNNFDGQMDPLLAFTVPEDGRYIARMNDLEFKGSGEHFYRLSVGALPYVTGVFPLSAPPNKETEVELTGYNLPTGSKVMVKTGPEGTAPVPLDANKYRFRQGLNVKVASLPEVVEAEPNDQPAKATALAVPATANGRIWAGKDAEGQSGDFDLYRFTAKKGESWIIETDAAGRGSPIDTKVEVLTAKGEPIERLLLQATRDSYVHFRGINSSTVDVRVKNWEEMELNEFMYLQGEVCKIFRMPQGPDSGFNFYAINGQRRCYFDTSATGHSLEELCYIVQPHAPGSQIVPNGLPVFTLHYSNDDAGDRSIGRDSKLTFSAPADGEYLVRVADVRSRGGDRFAYRLTVRRPEPGFNVRVVGANPTVGVGSGQRIKLVADRIDGFDGDITVTIDGLPPGFTVSSPVVIQAGHLEAEAVIHAAVNAPAPTKENEAKTTLSAVAQVNGATVTKPVASLGKIQLGPKPKLLVRLEPAEVTIAPGSSVPVKLIVERNGFDDRIQFDVDNLPHGVIVDNIGLSGILIPKDVSERTLFLTARKWVPETDRTCFAVTRVEGNQASPAIMLHVRKPKEVAELESSK